MMLHILGAESESGVIDVVIKDGVATTQNLVLVGRGGRALTSGDVNLPAWKLGTVTEVTLGQDTEPYLIAQMAGALDDPYVKKVSGKLLKSRAVSTPQPSTPWTSSRASSEARGSLTMR